MTQNSTQGEVTLAEVGNIRVLVADAIRETHENKGSRAVLDATIRRKLSAINCTWQTSYDRENDLWHGELCIHRDSGCAKVDMYNHDHNILYAMLGGYIFVEKSLLNYFYGRDDMISARNFIDTAITGDALSFAAVYELSPRDNKGMLMINISMHIATVCALILGVVVISKLF